MLQEDEAPVKGAIVTGGGRGIGRAAALAYAWEGASLAICSGTADDLVSGRWPSISGGLADGVLSQSRDNRHNTGLMFCPYFPFDRFRGGVLTNEKQGICANMYLPPQERHGPAAQEIFAHASLSLSR